MSELEKWVCPLCGQETSGDVCEWCQAAKPAQEAPVENEEALIEEATAEAGEEFDLEAEFGEDDLSQFATDMSAVEEDAAISEDLDGFASGFPDWDLLPPKNL